MANIDRLFELSLDLLCIVGRDGCFELVNPAFTRMLGYTQEELQGRPLVELVHPEDRAETLAMLERGKAGSPVTDLENRYRCKDGSYRWLAWRATPVVEGGHIYAVARDVTEHKHMDRELYRIRDELEAHIAMRTAELSEANSKLRQEIADRELAERERRASERRFESIAEVSPVGIIQTDTEALCLYVNQRWCEISGLSREQSLGRGWLEATHPEDLPRLFAARDQATPDHHSFQVEFRIQRPDGEWVWVLGDSTGEEDDDGELVGYVGTITDITERKKAEMALFNEKERLQVTLHSIGDGVITTDSQGIVEYMNPVAEALTGWALEIAQGRPLSQVFQIVDEQRRTPIADPVARCLEESRPVRLATHSVLISRSGREFAIQDSAAPIRDRDARVLGVVMVFSDVTESRGMVQKIAYQATHDALTGLTNRREFEQRLEHVLVGAREYQTQHALCYLDLDQFKIVNDSAGHVAGDELLKQLAVLLRQKIRSRDTLARLGGDEFGLLLAHCPLSKAVEIAEALVVAVRDFRFHWENRSFEIGVSIGVVPITADSESTVQLLSRADMACYVAKDLGRNRVHVFREEDNELARRQAEVLRAVELFGALEGNRFQLFRQPIVSLTGTPETPLYYEVLLRLTNSEGEISPPAAFLPAAERYGFMAAIDRWVIDTACRSFKHLPQGSPAPGIAINLSGSSLNDERLQAMVLQLMGKHGVSPSSICFEITETAAIRNLDRARRFIREMKETGCRFALDDFGTGLSSLAYLKMLPVDFLKIDGSFVREIANDPVNQAMVAAINDVGHNLGVETIAEWAETEVEVEWLRDLGVDYAQGYALGRPVPLEVADREIGEG